MTVTVTSEPIAPSLGDAARFVVALLIMVIVLKVIQTRAPNLTWPYVAVVLLGIAIYHREGVTLYLSTLTQQIKGATS